jgi:hypothetical protein
VSRHASEPQRPPGTQLLGLLGVLLAAILVVGVVSLLRQETPDPQTAETTTSTVSVVTTTTAQSSTTSSASVISTTSAVTTTAPATTTLADPVAALAMNPTGLGDLSFGSDADETVAQISLVLGSPTEDTGWTPTFETCPGTEARVVRWTSFQAFFTNGATEWAPEGTRHFFHYGQSITAGGGELIDLRTAAGIGINSTLGELTSAYGDRATIVDDPIFGPFWEVDGAGPGVLWGTAGSLGENGMIDSINGGSGCGE